jgi:hypothetical protein
MKAFLDVLVASALFCLLCNLAAAQPANPFGPADPPPGYNLPAAISGPSVVKGQKPGIEVGQYPPDFTLQPIQPYPALAKWLGAAAPKNVDDKVMLSQLVGKVPVMLLFGSYT